MPIHPNPIEVTQKPHTESQGCTCRKENLVLTWNPPPHHYPSITPSKDTIKTLRNYNQHWSFQSHIPLWDIVIRVTALLMQLPFHPKHNKGVWFASAAQVRSRGHTHMGTWWEETRQIPCKDIPWFKQMTQQLGERDRVSQMVIKGHLWSSTRFMQNCSCDVNHSNTLCSQRLCGLRETHSTPTKLYDITTPILVWGQW